MPNRISLLSFFLFPLCFAGATALAALPPLPECGPAPVLHVRFIGPAGMKATIYAGTAPARTFATPVAVGLRPGYLYRVQLTGRNDLPGVAVYPSLAVIGTLHLP